MAAQFRFIMHAAQAEAFEGPSHGSGNRLAQAGLADARRSDQAEDGRLSRGIQFQHGQMLDDPLLHFFNAVVILLKHLTHLAQLQTVFRGLLPWEFKHQFEIGPEDLMVRRGGWDFCQSGDLPLNFLSHMVRKIGFLNLLFELGDPVPFSLVLAELLLNRLQLFAKDILSLGLADLGLSLAGDLVPQL